MAQDLVVGGETYEGVERVAATNANGERIVYPEGGDTVSNAVKYIVQSLSDDQKAQARKNIGALASDAISFKYNAHQFNGTTENITTVMITVKKVVDGKEVEESVELNTTSLYEHAKLHGYTGEIKDFYDTLAKNMQTLKGDGLELDPDENILYITSGGVRIGTGVGLAAGSADAVQYVKQALTDEQKAQARANIEAAEDNLVIATISGNLRDDTLEWEYTVLWGENPAPAAGLNALVKSGKIVIGVADGDLGFRVFDDEAYNDSYVVPSGTVFNYNNGTFWFSNFADKDGEIKNMAFAIKAGYKDSPWWGTTYPSQYTIYLTGDQPGRIVECFGRKLEPREAYEILLGAANNDIPLLCYQKDAVFKLADGSTHTPQYGTPFYYDHNTELLHCEHDGYVCTLYVDLDVYNATAEKNTPYKTAESKADDLKAEDGTLFLLSAGEPIGAGVSIPTGNSNVFIGKYDTATYAEIKAAHDAGKVCFLDFNGISLPLLGTNDTEAMFVREINENTDYRVTITSAGGKDFTIVDKNISDVYVVSLFSAKYAEVKAAYDAGKACFVTYGALLCPLTVLDEEKAEFVGMLTPNMGIKGIVPAEGTIDWTYVRSNAVQTVVQSLSDDQKAQARSNIGAAAAADIAQTASLGISNSAAVYVKISDFGSWGTGAWYQKGFAMLITSRAGEMVWVAISSDDSNTNAKAIRLLNTYSKIAAIYYSASESAVYVKANAWCNNINAHIISNINGDYVPTVAQASALPSDAVQITITEFGAGSGKTSIGDASRALGMTGSATRPTYNGADMALSSDLSSYVTTDTAQTITGVKTFNAPSNVSGTEQHTAKFKTSNGGSIAFGKEGPNSGTMIRLDQADGTCRLRFRASATAGAMVWEQPEQGAQLYVDLGKEGVDKKRITFPSSGGTLALTSQIPSLSGYLPLSGGLMTGSIKFQAASLPGKSLQYICGIDAFASGGEMGWQSKADFLSGYLTTTGTAAKATADANGNNIANTYANKNAGNTFNGEQKMVNSSYAPTMNDIAGGVGCSLKNARACDNQLIVAEIFAPTTAATDSTINMNAVVGEIGFYHGGSGSGGQFTGKTQLARITSAGIYEGSTLLANKYVGKSSSGGVYVSGRYAGGGDDEGIVIGRASNNYAGLTLGDRTGIRSVFYLLPDNSAVWRYNNGSASYDIKHPGKAGTIALLSDVVEAANGALKVTLSGNDTDGYAVDKTYAEIKTAWDAGRYVYVTNGAVVCNPSLVNANLGFVFTYTRATGDGVEVWSVLVNNLGTKPTVVKKTITA